MPKKIIHLLKTKSSSAHSRFKSADKQKKQVAYLSALVLLIVLSAGTAAFYYKNYNNVKNNPQEVQAAVIKKNADDSERVLAKLKQAILIQETDQPTVARVDDPEKLQKTNAEFYQNVQTGDYLILYPKRAIIYREQTDQIVNIAPIINPDKLKPTN